MVTLSVSLLGCAIDRQPPGVELAEISSAACTPELPAAVAYGGQTLPIAGDPQIWVIVTATTKGDMQAALVNGAAARIDAMFVIPPSQLASFTDGVSTNQAIFPGHPNPPPPVFAPVPDRVDPAWLVFAGQHTLRQLSEARRDAEACAIARVDGELEGAPLACAAALPPITSYTRQPLPAADPDHIWVIAAPVVKNDRVAVLVDTRASTISAMLSVPAASLGDFTRGASVNQVVFVGHPPPAPPVLRAASGAQPAVDPAWLVLVAQHAATGLATAKVDTSGCADTP
jgi:hypothetical protein